MKKFLVFAALSALASSGNALAGAQIYEPLKADVRTGLQSEIADQPAPSTGFSDSIEAQVWLVDMSRRLQRHISDPKIREEFLRTVHYEATRAGLNPQLLLALIEVESRFRKFAVSKSGARGYMQVMPFWVDLIGRKSDKLFNLRTNLRYGCVILRHYLALEKGDIARALARYNGSQGKSHYARKVLDTLHKTWRYDGKLTTMEKNPIA